MTGGFFALLDDIGMLLDDTATAAKIAMKKTAGVLGDDLAVNAEKAAKDFSASRELPVIWKITKGSVINKIILLPIILLLSYFLPIMINPILFLGAAYLSYEGAEKVLEYLMNVHHDAIVKKTITEKEKIRSAIFTDFILSIEIILVALSSVSSQPFTTQIVVLGVVSIFATVFVYGIVTIIVRLDDTGYAIIRFCSELRLKHKEKRMLDKISVAEGFGKMLVISMREDAVNSQFEPRFVIYIFFALTLPLLA